MARKLHPGRPRVKEGVKLLNRLLIKTWLASLFFSSLVGLVPSVSPAAAVDPTCASTMTVQNNLKATPAHGKVFYIDSGVTPKVDASYVGYQISYSGTGTAKGLWASISTFTGGKVELANPADEYQRLEDIATGSYKTAYYLLKASAPTITSQGHTIKVYDRRPDLFGVVTLLTCTFSFSQVQETIKAQANKVTSVTATLDTAEATLGGKLTIDVAGSTGKVGAGKTPDFSLFWVSPAAVSSWPTRSLRLETVSIFLNCSGSTPDITLTNTLSKLQADQCFASGAAGTWTAKYEFRIIGPGPSSLTPYPVAMIASGTQYKHSDISSLSFATPINLSGVSSSSFSVTVNASSSVVSSTSTEAIIRYTISMTTTSSVPIFVDEVIDNVATGVTFRTGTAKLNGNTIADPIYLASEQGLSPPPLHYIGPFSVVGPTVSTKTTIVYDMTVPCSVSSATYRNTVYAKIGDQILGSSSTLLSAALVTTVSASSSCTVNTSTDTTSITPTGQTNPATNVASSGSSSTATLNGYANAYSQSGVTARFRYSTDANLVSNAILTTPVSVTGASISSIATNITGLSINTKYYFRIEVTSSTETKLGSTLSFITPDVLAAPTLTTGVVSNITIITSGPNKDDYKVTLNGTVNAHLNTLTPVAFQWSTSSSMTSPSSVNVVIEDTNGQSTNLSISGSSDTPVNSDDISSAQTVTPLVSNTTYYYRVVATCSVTTSVCSSGTVVLGNTRQFTIGSPLVTTTAPSSVGATTSTITGTFDANSSTTPEYRFAYCESGASCSSSAIGGTVTYTTTTSGSGLAGSSVTANLTGLTGGRTYFYQLIGRTSSADKSFGDILSFTTLDIPTTSPLPGGTLNNSYSASVTGNGGSSSYSFSATGLPSGLSMATTGVISGSPTQSGTFSSVVVTLTDLSYNTTTTKTFTLVVLSVTTSSASSVGSTTATLNGSTSVSSPEDSKFCYSATNPGGNFDSSSCVTSTAGSNTGYTANLVGLTPATTYYFQLTIVSGSTRYYGQLLTFTTKATYSVTYDANGGDTGSVPASQTKVEDTNLTLSTDVPTRTGHTFSSWNTVASGAGGTTYNSGATYSTNAAVVLYARWTVNSYTLTFDLAGGVTGGGNLTPSVPYLADGLGSSYKPTNPTRDTFSFLGWGTSSDPLVLTVITNYSMPATASTLYAKWSNATTYTVTYNDNVDTQTITVPIDSNSYLDAGVVTISNLEPTRSGYTFMGWTTDSGNTGTIYKTDGTSSYTIAAANVIFYAKWSINSYTLTYDGNGSTSGSPPASVTQNYNSTTTISNRNTLVRTGYTFLRWRANSNLTGDIFTVGSTYTFSGTQTIYAEWTINTYTLYYNGNGNTGGSAPSSVTGNYNSDTTVSGPGTLVYSGKTFNGWRINADGTGAAYPEGSTFTFTDTTTVYAQWSTDPTYSVSYSDNVSGETIEVPSDSASYASGATVTIKVLEPTRSGFTFNGWTTDAGNTGALYKIGGTSTYVITSNTTFFAKWTANSLTVTYNSQGGSSISSGTTTTGGSISASPGTPTRDGYTFNGWFAAASGGSAITFSYAHGQTANFTLYAQWTANTSAGETPAPPPGPHIDSISKAEICAVGDDITISGNYFDGGTVTFDGASIAVKSLSASSISLSLPKAAGGEKTLRVTTPNGSVSITIKYVDVPKPKFVSTLMPYMSQGDYLILPVVALNATSFSLIGTLPQGMVFDSRSGTISGTPSENGIFGFVVTATGICGESSQVLELDIDKETPNAISHRINILPGATCISDSAKASLDAFLEKVKSLAPRNLIPEIYMSGGGIGTGSDLGDERRDCLCELFLDEEVYGNVLEGEFIGSANRIEIIVYWARP